jgi:hypothetical protein
MKVGTKVLINGSDADGLTGVIVTDDLNLYGGDDRMNVVRFDNPPQKWLDMLPGEVPKDYSGRLFWFYPNSTKTQVKGMFPDFVLEVVPQAKG